MLTYLLPIQFFCYLLCDIYFFLVSVLMVQLIINVTENVFEKWVGSGFPGKKGRDGGINR